MCKIHTIDYICTSQMLKSFRACINMTGKSQVFADIGRVYLAKYKRLNRIQQVSGKNILLRRVK